VQLLHVKHTQLTIAIIDGRRRHHFENVDILKRNEQKIFAFVKLLVTFLGHVKIVHFAFYIQFWGHNVFGVHGHPLETPLQ